MPIYAFRCNQCNAQFDQLCGLDWQTSAKCPVCGATNLAKTITTFSAPGSGGSNCGSCTGKNCGSCK